MSFENFGLSTDLLRALNTQGYTTPTPIQEKAIPLILKGGDIIAGAQTGTGKTAAFSLPLLHRLMETSAPTNGKRPIRALILAPTRELAIQIGENIASYSQHLPIKSAVVFGGVSINPQIDKLRKGVDVLVATPGRLLDHASQNTLSLKHVEFLVLDEADRMLDMGFIHDIKKVLALLPERSQRQNLLFSATTSKDIKQLANRLMNQPETVEVASSNATADKVSQVMYRVEKSAKRDLLRHLITSKDWYQVLVFTRTKHGANRLAQQLEKNGIQSAAIHGNKSQGARTRALSEFKSGKVRVLVATDIAARGLDIDQLPNVVNYELPNVPEDYIHRIGRTARAGNTGEAVSLVDAEEVSYLKGIEKLLNCRIPEQDAGSFERTPGSQSENQSRPRNDGSNTRPKKRSANSNNRSGRSSGQGPGQNSAQRNGNRSDAQGNNAGQRRRTKPRSGNRSSNRGVVA